MLKRICDVCGCDADTKYVGTLLLRLIKNHFDNEDFDICSSCGDFIEELIVQNIKNTNKEAKEKEVKM